jgi:hypothetical protein
LDPALTGDYALPLIIRTRPDREILPPFTISFLLSLLHKVVTKPYTA